MRRIGHSFALRAAEKKEMLVEQIKAHNPHLYRDTQSAISEIKKRYRDVYAVRPFANLEKRSYHLPGSAQMIVSDLDSTDTREWIRLHPPAAPFVWVATQVLDEPATNALYEATPYVYILPNFLPHYARREAIHHLKNIWRISSIRTLQSTIHDPARVGADLARR